MHTDRYVRLLQIVTVVVGIALLANALFYDGILLTFPYGVDDSEGVVLDQAWRLARGLALYPPIEHEPYILSVYTPLYPALVSLLLRATGPLLWGARLLSFLSFLGIIAASAGILRRLHVDRWWTFVGVLLIALSPTLVHWAALCRVDMLGLLFVLLGWWRYAGDQTRRGALIAAGFFLLALMTKQTLLAAPIALFIDRIRRERARGLQELFLFAAVLAGLLVGLQLASGGTFFGHSFLYVATPPRLSQLMHYLQQFLFEQAPLLVVLLLLLASPARTDRESGWLRLYFLFALLAGFGSLKTGSGENFWFEAIIALALLFALFGDRATRTPDATISWKAFLAGVVLLQLLLIGVGHRIAPERAQPLAALRRAEGDRISAIVRETAGPVLVENADWAVLNGKAFLFDAFSFAQLHYQERWDQTPVVARIEGGDYDLVLLSFPLDAVPALKRQRFTPEVLAALRERYTLSERIGRWHLYVPRG